MSEAPGDAWERDDYVRRSVVLPAELAERLAVEADRRGVSVSDLLAEYAEEGLRRPGEFREYKGSCDAGDRG
jgi:CopG-like RHH_1 or ribbon-helix-helix domain, RHH_5